LDLPCGGATVQEDTLQSPLLAEECGQAGCMRRRVATSRRFEQQSATVGMAGLVKDGDAVAVLGILEDLEDAVRGGVRLVQDLAVPRNFGARQCLTNAAHFFAEVAQMA